jgi:HSP20 family molecular chaperone IbpA
MTAAGAGGGGAISWPATARAADRVTLERSFERTFRLRTDVDGEQVTAAFEKGFLKVHARSLRRRTSQDRDLEVVIA